MNKWIFQYSNSKGQVFISQEVWGISVKIVNQEGVTLDSWDGKSKDMPARFNKES